MTSSTAAHSQAFNFMSFLQNGVDPRTGQYTVSINFPEIKCNELCGPVVPLGLAFNPINVLDSGFGLGWNLNLSQFTPNDSILALSTGETYKVTGSPVMTFSTMATTSSATAPLSPTPMNTAPVPRSWPTASGAPG
ncbi:hypothetical protein M1E16_09365 [Pseudomonas sp. Z2-11]